MAATTFVELWNELKADAAAAVKAVEAKAVELEHYIVPVIEADLAMAFSQLKSVAIQAVMEAATLGLTGNEKLGTVVTTVYQHAEANAINIGLTDAQLLAQQAYNAVATSLNQPTK